MEQESPSSQRRVPRGRQPAETHEATGGASLSRVQPVKAIERRIQAAFSDWLNLLQGPHCDAFKEGVKKEQWSRLFRLLLLSVLLSSVALGSGLIGVDDASWGLSQLVLTSGPAMMVMLGAALLVAMYRFSAFVFRIPISLPRSFFALLFLWLPWLPLVALTVSVEKFEFVPLRGAVYGFGPFAVLSVALYNFGRGVIEVVKFKGRSKWRVWASIILPVALILWILYED